ncbi:MAG: hypothetical protein QXT77_08940 [Candidatus Methanomethylicaceae archaeon]
MISVLAINTRYKMDMEETMEDTYAKSPIWPKVAIIILNWNGWRDTIECLESLQRLTYPTIDNCHD